jgi:hypothetical protein
MGILSWSVRRVRDLTRFFERYSRLLFRYPEDCFPDVVLKSFTRECVDHMDLVAGCGGTMDCIFNGRIDTWGRS